jgi:hypothetical protein
VVVVSSFEDAVIALLFNSNIQSAVIRYSFPFTSTTHQPLLRSLLDLVDVAELRDRAEQAPARTLGEALKSLRPEVDLFLVTDDPLRNVAAHTGQAFRRVFYHLEDYLELHLSLLRGIDDRHETPFFDALREYSHRPTGVFHAMPISRGKSIMKSHWIGDMGDFYGRNTRRLGLTTLGLTVVFWPASLLTCRGETRLALLRAMAGGIAACGEPLAYCAASDMSSISSRSFTVSTTLPRRISLTSAPSTESPT